MGCAPTLYDTFTVVKCDKISALKGSFNISASMCVLMYFIHSSGFKFVSAVLIACFWDARTDHSKTAL